MKPIVIETGSGSFKIFIEKGSIWFEVFDQEGDRNSSESLSLEAAVSLAVALLEVHETLKAETVGFNY